MCSALDKVVLYEVLTLQASVIQKVLVRLPQLPRPGVPVHSSQRYLPPSPYHLEKGPLVLETVENTQLSS